MTDESATTYEPAPAAPGFPKLASAVRALLGWPLLAIAASGLAIAIVRGVAHSPRFEADTIQLVLGARRSLDCLLGDAGGTCAHVSYFPLLQHLPSGLVLLAGGSPVHALHGLVWLNLAAWIATAVLLAVQLERARGPLAAALGLAAWLGGYGLAYANSSFGEILTGFLALAFAIGCARRWPSPLVGLLGLLAGLGKETAPPFIALLGASAFLSHWARAREERRVPWRSILVLLVAGAGSAGAHAAFNLWRYGTSGNPFLLQPLLRAPDPGQWLGSLAALWVSPHGGLILFAPTAMALTCGAGLWALWRALRGAGGWASAAPALGSLAVLLVTTIGLASWYSPFGWWAWGPRLVLPWLPACLFLVLSSPLPLDMAAARVLSRTGRFVLVAVLLAGAVVVHAAALHSPAYLAHFNDNPACGVVVIQRDPVGFFRHLDCLMWNTETLLLGRMLAAALEPAALLTVLPAVLLQVALLWRAREALRRTAT